MLERIDIDPDGPDFGDVLLRAGIAGIVLSPRASSQPGGRLAFGGLSSATGAAAATGAPATASSTGALVGFAEHAALHHDGRLDLFRAHPPRHRDGRFHEGTLQLSRGISPGRRSRSSCWKTNPPASGASSAAVSAGRFGRHLRAAGLLRTTALRGRIGHRVERARSDPESRPPARRAGALEARRRSPLIRSSVCRSARRHRW